MSGPIHTLLLTNQSKIGRMGDILKNTASTQIDDYQQRFSAVSGFYGLLFKDLIVDKCYKKAAYETAKKFFGVRIFRYVDTGWQRRCDLFGK